MITDDSRGPFDFLLLGFIISAQVLCIIVIDIVDFSSGTSSYEQKEWAAHMIHKEHHPFPAAVLHWSIFEVMANGY